MKIKHIIAIGMIPTCFVYKAFEGIVGWSLSLINIDLEKISDKLERKIKALVAKK